MKEALRSRVEAFFREFPFLRQYLPNNGKVVVQPVVQRVDLDLMDRMGNGNYCCHQSSRWLYTSFFLIDNKGYQLALVRPHIKIKQEFRLFRPRTWFLMDVPGETVYECIQKLKDTDKDRLTYILEVKEGSCDGFSFVIHKIPRCFSFSCWIANIQMVADLELREKLIDVDNVK